MLALVHPFPSALNALLVVGLATLAGASASVALLLGLGMLGLQFAIGAANDWFDVDLDARAKPAKPIPAGVVERPVAALVAVACAGAGLAAAFAASGPVDLRAALLGVAILAIGLVYDARLKRTAWGWLAFALAFPLLPLYAWYGAAGVPPPRLELLLPVAFLAGPTLQLANGLVDLERDARVGVVGLAGALGRRRALVLLATLEAVVHGLAWLTLVASSTAGPLVVASLGAASLAGVFGVALSTSRATDWREWGWRCQAVGIASLALGWLTSARG